LKWDGPVAGIPDAMVRTVDELPSHLPGADRIGMYAEAIPGQLLQKVPGIATYLARDGATIDVAPAPGADPGAVDLFLNGAIRAALIHQRGELPLHAATLVPPRGGGAVAICGPSGIGKSSLAAELSRRGWLLLADDTTRLTFDGTNAIAWHGRGTIKLWRDACETLGRSTEGLERVREGMEKFFLPVPSLRQTTALDVILELNTSASRLAPVSGVQKMALLSEHTVRPRQIKPLGRLAEHLRIVAQVANATRIFHLGGARQETVTTLADRIIAKFASAMERQA
jgi:hypothetical protein